MHALQEDETIIVFKVGPITLCASVLDVDSITLMQPFRVIPGQADFIAGVFNYRGKTISAVNTHIKFGLRQLGKVEHRDTMRIIVSQTTKGMTGFIVDEIVDITKGADLEWSEPPIFVTGNIFDKTLHWNDTMILHTNFDRLFAMKEVEPLQKWAVKQGLTEQSSFLAEADESMDEALQSLDESIAKTAEPDAEPNSSLHDTDQQANDTVLETESDEAHDRDARIESQLLEQQASELLNEEESVDDIQIPDDFPADAVETPDSSIVPDSSIAVEEPTHHIASEDYVDSTGLSEISSSYTDVDQSAVTQDLTTDALDEADAVLPPEANTVVEQLQEVTSPENESEQNDIFADEAVEEDSPALLDDVPDSQLVFTEQDGEQHILPSDAAQAYRYAEEPAVASEIPSPPISLLEDSTQESAKQTDSDSTVRWLPRFLLLFGALFAALISYFVYQQYGSSVLVSDKFNSQSTAVQTRAEAIKQSNTSLADSPNETVSGQVLGMETGAETLDTEAPAVEEEHGSTSGSSEEESVSDSDEDASTIATTDNLVSELKADIEKNEPELLNAVARVDKGAAVKQDSVVTVTATAPAPSAVNPQWGQHEVVRGDTLWDLSARYLQNPFKYPDLARWSKIKNPDLIYPGEQVKYKKSRD